MNQRTRKFMTMHMDLHPWVEIGCLHGTRKEGGRRLASVEDNVDASIRQLEDNIKKEQRLITASRNNTKTWEPTEQK